MKKLLGLLAIAPLTIAACGGSDDGGDTFVPAKYTVEGVNVTSNTGIIDNIQSGDIDFAGTWGDARRFNGTATDKSDVIAVGVVESRVANDGIQARPDMDAEDINAVQELFIQIVGDDSITVDLGNTDDDGTPYEDHVLEVYGHENYDPIKDDSREVTYLNLGKPVEKAFITTEPKTGAGTMFDANGMLNADQKLNVMFIPSTNPTHAQSASTALETWLKAEIATASGSDVTVTVATDYDAAATQLEEGTIDLAFLPVNTWAESAPSTQFILQAGRSAQVATLDFDPTATTKVWQPNTMTNQKLTADVMNRFSQLYVTEVTTEALGASDADDYQLDFKKALETDTDEFHDWAVAVNAAADAGSIPTVAGSYESIIWAKDGSDFAKAVQAVNDEEDFVIDIDGMDLKSGFTSTTSSSTYVFPELWIYNHLNATVKLN